MTRFRVRGSYQNWMRRVNEQITKAVIFKNCLASSFSAVNSRTRDPLRILRTTILIGAVSIRSLRNLGESFNHTMSAGIAFKSKASRCKNSSGNCQKYRHHSLPGLKHGLPDSRALMRNDDTLSRIGNNDGNTARHPFGQEAGQAAAV